MTNNPANQLSLIVISYNSYETIERCLLATLFDLNIPTFFVDNASSDGGSTQIKRELPNAHVIRLEQNIGYGRAANCALRQVETPYALLLNPDILASSEDILSLLEFALKDTQNTAIWGPRGKHTPAQSIGTQVVSEVNGSAMLLDVRKLKPLVFFDENIFLFCEEHDLCARARKEGYQILECCEINFGHLEGQSCGSNQETEDLKNWHFGWSFAYFQTKHFPATAPQKIRQKLKGYQRKAFLQITRRKRREFRKKVAGIQAFLRGSRAFSPKGNPLGLP